MSSARETATGNLVPSRWLFLIATALAAGSFTEHPAIKVLVQVAVLLAGSAVHLVTPAVFHSRRFEKRLLFADTLLIAAILMISAPAEVALTTSFLVTVIFAALVGDRWRTVLAAGALLLFYGAVSFEWSPGLGGVVPWLVPRIAFLATAALYFGLLAERVAVVDRSILRQWRESGQLRTLLEITDTINRSLDLREVMSEIVRRVGSLVQSESCSILVAGDTDGQCFVVASDDHPEVDMLEVELEKYPEIRKALETREPVVIDDVENDPVIASVRDVLLEKGYGSVAVLPLIFGDEVLGALFLRARRDRPFTPAELRFCQVAAGASSNALKNARLFRDVRRESDKHRTTGEKLRRVLDGTPDLIVATDGEGRIVEFNRGAEQILGIPAGEARGRPLDQILVPMERRALKDRRLDDGLERSEVVIGQDEGEPVELSLVTAPLVGVDGGQTGEVCIGRDMTKLRRVERSLAQAERLSSLGEVVAGVAHELNNPLSGVVGYAELLRSAIDDPSKVRDLERILESARRCQRIVLNLLSFSRKHTPEKRVQDLNQCVRKVLELKEYHLRACRIETVLELDPQLPATSFDFHQVEQVLLNLINNAEQSIGTTKQPGKILVRTRTGDGAIHLDVEDDGPGVPEHVRERVFDPFFTTKDIGEGTGLGLSVSYGLVQEHDGKIELQPDSTLGGACFTVTLPIVLEGPAGVAEAGDTADEEQRNPLAGRRILIAEDEDLVLELLTRILRQDGADVTPVHDGQEAWEYLNEADYDLVLVDLRMPGLDGQGLYERVAEERPEMIRRFVFATGDMVRPETVDFLGRVPNHILTKPLQVETVRRVVGHALEDPESN